MGYRKATEHDLRLSDLKFTRNKAKTRRSTKAIRPKAILADTRAALASRDFNVTGIVSNLLVFAVAAEASMR